MSYINKRIKSYFVWLIDILIREPRLIFRYYLPLKFVKPANINNSYIFMADGRIPHGGMFDRLKGIISIYAIAKSQNKNFKINFTSPFELSKYLQPNNYDWIIEKNSILYSFPISRPLFLYGECYYPHRVMKKRNKESHFYFGYDILKNVNFRYKKEYEWGTLYRELFIPTPYLQKYIDYYKQDIGCKYIAIHTRFLNLLGDKNETDINPELSEIDKNELMEKVLNAIKQIHTSYNKTIKLMLASDSMLFINYAKNAMEDIYVIPGVVKHIDTAKQVSDSENLKMFLDYYLISNAEKVYSIVSDGMWPSAFPEYAAKIGNIAFERIKI